MRDVGVTRRRALGLGAAAGLGAVLGRPFAALARGTAAPRGFGLRIAAADFPAGSRTSRVLRAPRRFDLVGLRGLRGDVEIRARRAGGPWTPWVPLTVHGDHAPDATPSRPARRASDPVWTGGSDDLQVRVRAGAPLPSELRVHLVAVPASARRRVVPRGIGARIAQEGTSAPPPYITRDQWGAAAVPPRAAPSYGDVQMAFVHHTVNANTYGPQDSPGIVLGIAKYHRDTNGWNDIGYNFLVDQYGQVFEGRGGGIDQPVVGAQAQGYNTHSTGVAVLGTFQSVPFPEAALEAVARVVGWKLSLHGAPIEGTLVLESAGGDLNRYKAGTPVTFQRISGHRDGDATSCPGDAAYAQLPDIRARARRWTFTPPPSAVVAQLTLAAEAPQVVYGSVARVAGTVVRGDGQPNAGAAVSIQKRTSSAWSTIARATADGAGTWSAAPEWRATGDLRAVVQGASSPVVRVLCLPAVDARPVARRVREGGSVRVRGGVRPASAVTVLVERQGSDGKWRRSTAVRARVRGKAYDASVKLKHAGLYRLTPKAGTPAANSAAPPIFVRAVHGTSSTSARRAGGTSSPGPARPPSTGGVAA